MKNLRIGIIGRNQSAVKQHGKNHQKHQKTSAGKFRLGKAISHQTGDNHAQSRSYKGYNDRNCISPANYIKTVNDIFVGFQAEFFRKQGISVYNRCRLIRKGGHQKHHKRKQHQNTQSNHDHMGQDLVNRSLS